LSNFAFFPTAEQKENSNISRFMKKHKISSLEELSTKAKNNFEWFWKEVEKDIEIFRDKEYEKVLD